MVLKVDFIDNQQQKKKRKPYTKCDKETNCRQNLIENKFDQGNDVLTEQEVWSGEGDSDDDNDDDDGTPVGDTRLEVCLAQRVSEAESGITKPIKSQPEFLAALWRV